MRDNPNCDGVGPHAQNAQVRIMPLTYDDPGIASNIIVCRACHLTELRWRKQRNRELSPEAQYDLPSWESLKVYAP